MTGSFFQLSLTHALLLKLLSPKSSQQVPHKKVPLATAGHSDSDAIQINNEDT